MKIENSYACFVMLWQELGAAQFSLESRYKRYCIRRIFQAWFPCATDDFIFQVCTLCRLYGYDTLPPPALNPYPHREFLRALVAVRLGIGMRAVDLRALDAAYSAAYPRSTPLNVSKKKRIP